MTDPWVIKPEPRHREAFQKIARENRRTAVEQVYAYEGVKK